MFYRGDVAGALNTVLDGAPYGPNVEEAKVRVTTLFLASSLIYVCAEHKPTNPLIDPQQHQSSGDLRHNEVTLARRARYVDEVPLQGHGNAWLGRRQCERIAGMA